MKIMIRTSVVVLLLIALPVSAGFGQDAAYYFALAKMLAGEGAVGAALENFRKAIQEDPDDPYLRIEYADFLYRIRRLAQAGEEGRKATELAPDNPDALRVYGKIQVGLAGIDPEALEEAREAFEGVRRHSPEDIQSMLALGQIYSRLGRPEKSVEVYEEVVRHHPDNQQLTALLVDALMKADQKDRAADVLREALRLDPGASRQRLALARILIEREDHEEALKVLLETPPEARADVELRTLLARELFRRASGLPSGDEQRVEDLPRALATIESVLAQHPTYVDGHFLRIRILVEQSRNEEALEELRKLRRLVPEDTAVARALAQLLQQEGHREEALGLLDDLAKRLAKSDPDTGDEVRFDILLLHARADDWEKVEELASQLFDSVKEELRLVVLQLYADSLIRLDRAKEALELLGKNKDEVNSSLQLGIKQAEVLFALGREEKAHRVLADLVADSTLDPLLAAVQFYLFQRQDFARSVPLLNRAIASEDVEDGSPEEVELYFLLGQAHERLGQPEPAEISFRKVLEIDPDHSMTLNYLGYMWADSGENLQEALELVKRAVSLEPDNGAYVDSLGWALYQLGHYQDAQEHLERAAELIPEDATILEHLGDLYVALRQIDKARASYEKAVAVDDQENVEQVRRKLAQLNDGS